ncbi:MAG: DUF2461 domain-containing protein [Actinomycetota bacterium]
MAFFTDESVRFWKGLAANNSKAWFDEHRKDYERHLKKPYNELAAALVEQVTEVEPEYETDAKGAVYRINRDTRFANDKTPYKTRLGITVGRHQKHDPDWPAYTCSVGVDGITVAGGLYMPGNERRDRVRRYVGEHAAELAKLERKSTRFGKSFGALQGDAHKRAPAELKELAEIEPRVLNKQWVFWAEFDESDRFTDPKLDQFILDKWEAARPVQEFLKAACRA